MRMFMFCFAVMVAVACAALTVIAFASNAPGGTVVSLFVCALVNAGCAAYLWEGL